MRKNAKGKKLDDALEITNKAVAEALAVFRHPRCTAPIWLLKGYELLSTTIRHDDCV
jgi:NifU-like protein involved in Fe-S cluster formation